jgi:hypothetical protein
LPADDEESLALLMSRAIPAGERDHVFQVGDDGPPIPTMSRAIPVGEEEHVLQGHDNGPPTHTDTTAAPVREEVHTLQADDAKEGLDEWKTRDWFWRRRSCPGRISDEKMAKGGEGCGVSANSSFSVGPESVAGPSRTSGAWG